MLIRVLGLELRRYPPERDELLECAKVLMREHGLGLVRAILGAADDEPVEVAARRVWAEHQELRALGREVVEALKVPNVVMSTGRWDAFCAATGVGEWPGGNPFADADGHPLRARLADADRVIERQDAALTRVRRALVGLPGVEPYPHDGTDPHELALRAGGRVIPPEEQIRRVRESMVDIVARLLEVVDEICGPHAVPNTTAESIELLNAIEQEHNSEKARGRNARDSVEYLRARVAEVEAERGQLEARVAQLESAVAIAEANGSQLRARAADLEDLTVELETEAATLRARVAATEKADVAALADRIIAENGGTPERLPMVERLADAADNAIGETREREERS